MNPESDQTQAKFLAKHLKPSIDVTLFNGKDETLITAIQYLQDLNLSNVSITKSMLRWDAYLHTLEDFDKVKTELSTCKTQFFVVLLHLTVPDHEHQTISRHCNALIFDLNNHSIERFDPIGQTLQNYNPDSLKKVVAKKFNEYNMIDLYTIDQGIQTLQCLEPVRRIHHQTDPPGFCAAWVIWYIEARFSDPLSSATLESSVKQLNLFTEILNNIKYVAGESKITLRGFIRNYSHHIIQPISSAKI